MPEVTQSNAEKAVRIAQGVLDGSIPVFIGCKQLVWPLSVLGVHHDEPFVTITGVESELHESPLCPEERKLWNKQALAREDAKLAAWLPKIQPALFKACREIVRRFGNCE